jgi:regulatory protein
LRVSSFQAALSFLARRDYFRRELAQRLAKKGYDEDEIAGAIERVQQLGYLDDERLARRFAELRAASRGWGPNRLVAELRRRGVAEGIARSAAQLQEETHAEALSVALRRAENRAAEGWWKLHDKRARMVSSLIRRGFQADEASTAIAALAAKRENEHHAIDDI